MPGVKELHVNGTGRPIDADPDRSLLSVLRAEASSVSVTLVLAPAATEYRAWPTSALLTVAFILPRHLWPATPRHAPRSP